MFKDLLASKFAEYQTFVRRRMVEDQIAARGVRDGRVLEAMGKVRRHAFVDEYLRTRAYEDHPLPIDEGQTISQPYMVALTAELLNLKGSEKVLEIGTGSGYQTAVLAELAGELYTVEIFPSLAEKASAALTAQGYRGIKFRTGDGADGWPEHAPYDAIVLSCAAPA
ncbi:MAG TPA: protein-L-isoaspartate O-methyltransferase, partial [Elusimicrobiales bacterium]|nr:protein-L-isoaspartate O-methyltransferase [Elusimicrobiales bacterium]